MERYQNSDLVKVGLTPPYLPLAKLPTVHERTHSTDVYTKNVRTVASSWEVFHVEAHMIISVCVLMIASLGFLAL